MRNWHNQLTKIPTKGLKMSQNVPLKGYAEATACCKLNQPGDFPERLTRCEMAAFTVQSVHDICGVIQESF